MRQKEMRPAAWACPRNPQLLVKPELNFDIDRNRDRLAIFKSRFKLPFVDRFHRFFVESQPKAARELDLAWLAVGSHNQTEHAHSLILRLARFFRVLRIRSIDRLGRTHSATDSEHPAANSATAALANSWARADANSAAAAGTNSTA